MNPVISTGGLVFLLIGFGIGTICGIIIMCLFQINRKPVYSLDGVTEWVLSKDFRDKDFICSKIVYAALQGRSIYQRDTR
jgi:hypothetical protein